MLNRVELLNLSLFLHFQTNSCILQIRLLIMLIEKRTCCETTSISWSTSINDVVKSSMKQSGSQHSLIRPRIDLARSDGLFHAALMGADACEALATFTQDAYIIHIYISLCPVLMCKMMFITHVCRELWRPPQARSVRRELLKWPRLDGDPQVTLWHCSRSVSLQILFRNLWQNVTTIVQNNILPKFDT
jgi:hypothetical protein